MQDLQRCLRLWLRNWARLSTCGLWLFVAGQACQKPPWASLLQRIPQISNTLDIILHVCLGIVKLTTWDILLIGKDQEQRVLHFPILYDPRQFAPCLFHPVPVV